MKKFISLLLAICMVTSLIFVLPITATGTSISSGGSSSVGNSGSGVVGPVASATPVNITDFSYDDKGNVGFVASDIPDDATVYVGAFDVNNRLLELQELLLYNKADYAEFSTENVAEYRAFVWQNMKPLCESVVAIQVPLVNKTISILLSDVIDFTGDRFRYYDGDNISSIYLASNTDITFTYNGITIDQYDNSSDLKNDFEDCFNIDTDIAYSGQVKLVDDGTANGYSTINLEVAVSAVVDEVFGTRVEFKEPVRTTDGKAIRRLDFDPDDPEIVIEITKNGEEIDYTQLAEWDVLTILANDITEDYFVEVVDNKIEGMIEAREWSDASYDGYRYKIGNKWYDIAYYAYGGEELNISAEGIFYIDRYGKIAAFKKSEKNNSGIKYAYIMNAAVTCDEWNNYSIMVRLLDESGEVYEKYLDPTLYIENIDTNLQDAIEGDGVSFLDEEIDGISYTNAKIKMETFASFEDIRIENLTDALINKFVTYTLLDDNIKTITFPMNEPNEEVYMVNMVAAGAAEYDERYMEIRIGSKRYDVSDETLVFYINSEDGSVIEDGAIASEDLSMVSKTTTMVAGSYNYVEVYDLENDRPKVLVVYDDSIKVSPYSNIAVIEAVDSTSVTYWMNGEKAIAYSDYTDMFNVGDIWKLSLDGTTIVAARRIASYNRDITEAGEDGGAVFDQATGSEDIIWGPVTDSSGTNNRFSFAAENNFDDIQSIAARRANVYIVESVKGDLQILVGTADDAEYDQDLIDAAMSDYIQIVDRATGDILVEAGEAPLGMMDYIYAVSYDNEVQDVVIYKAADFGRWRAEEVW